LKISTVSGFAVEMACKRKHSKYSSIISSNYIFKGLALEILGPWYKEAIDFINVIGNRLAIIAIQNQRNFFSKGFPLPFNVETHFSRFRIIIGNFCIVKQKYYVLNKSIYFQKIINSK
jgi:hypothetical protein